MKEEKEKNEVAECTFKPRIQSKSPVEMKRRDKTPPPSGYEDTVNRMRMAN